MMGAVVDVIWTGFKEFQRAMDETIAKQAVASKAALAASAHKVEAEAKTLLTTTSHKKGTPTPSRPGEPPSLVSGSLRRSVVVDGPKSVGTNTWEAKIGPTIIYGRIQELGGTAGRGSTLPPRPYMKPALENAKAFIVEAFRKAWSWGG